MRNDPGRAPHVWLRIDEWIDAWTIIKGCALPAARAGSTLHFQVDSAIVLQPVHHLGNPHYSMFHLCSGAIISTMHIDQLHAHNLLGAATIQLFHTLGAMPSLLDLAIRLDNVPHLTRRTKTPAIPFRLRRLELRCVFRGWPRLLAQSGETLTDLTLGRPDVVQDQAFLEPNDYGKIRSVTTLRLDNIFDTAIFLACPKLRNLELNTQATGIGRRLGVGPITMCIAAAPRTLQSLVLGFRPSRIGLAFWGVIDLLNSRPPALAALRCLTVQACYDGSGGFQDMLALDDKGRTARAILEDVCRRRRVALSIH